MRAEAHDGKAPLGDGADVAPPPVKLSIEQRVARAQAMIKAELGELPKGRVNAFIAERRAAAARGE